MERRRLFGMLKRSTAVVIAAILICCPLTANAAETDVEISLSEDSISGLISEAEAASWAVSDEIDEEAADTGEETGEAVKKEALDTIVEFREEEGTGPQYPDPYKTVYLFVGESILFRSFENSSFDEYFPGKRTQKYNCSQKGIVKHLKRIDKTGVIWHAIAAVKPGHTEVWFTTTFDGGSYTTIHQKVEVVKPVLTQTKFNNITSLRTTINMADYVTGLEDFDRDYTVKWVSSKPSVAQVDETTGLVTMMGTGTAKITGTFTTEYDVKAVVTATVAVKLPKLSKKSVTLIPGQKIRISLSNLPKGKTADSWSLDSWGYKVRDEDYRSGLEKNENGNSCEVTAYMECGGKLTAFVDGDPYVCEITVKPPVIKKEQVTLKKGKSTKITVSGTKFKPDVFSYVSNDTAVATVDDKGKVTAVGSGTTYIDVYLFQTKACPRDRLSEGGGRVKITVP